MGAAGTAYAGMVQVRTMLLLLLLLLLLVLLLALLLALLLLPLLPLLLVLTPLTLQVHYTGWAAKWDEWIPADSVRAPCCEFLK